MQGHRRAGRNRAASWFPRATAPAWHGRCAERMPTIAFETGEIRSRAADDLAGLASVATLSKPERVDFAARAPEPFAHCARWRRHVLQDRQLRARAQPQGHRARQMSRQRDARHPSVRCCRARPLAAGHRGPGSQEAPMPHGPRLQPFRLGGSERKPRGNPPTYLRKRRARSAAFAHLTQYTAAAPGEEAPRAVGASLMRRSRQNTVLL